MIKRKIGGFKTEVSKDWLRTNAKLCFEEFLNAVEYNSPSDAAWWAKASLKSALQINDARDFDMDGGRYKCKER